MQRSNLILVETVSLLFISVLLGFLPLCAHPKIIPWFSVGPERASPLLGLSGFVNEVASPLP